MVAQLTAEDFANLTIPENMRISRDGKLVMYTVRNLTRNDPEPFKSAIWIAEIGKENSARGLVPASFTVNVPAFSPNGESIAFISNLAVSFLKLDNSLDVTQLISVAKHGYVSAFRWSQNGKRIVFAAQPKDETSPSDVKIYGENLRYSNLLNVTLDSQEVSKLIDAKAHVVNFELNAEGNKVYYCTRSASDFHSGYHGQDIRVLDLSSQVPISIYRTPYRIGGFSLSGETVVLGSPFNIDEEYFHHSPSIHLIKDGRDVWHVYGEAPILALIQDSTGVPSEVYSVVDGRVCQLSSRSEDIAKTVVVAAQIIEEYHEGIPMTAFWSIPPTLQSDLRKKALPTVIFVKGGTWGRVADCFGDSLL